MTLVPEEGSISAGPEGPSKIEARDKPETVVAAFNKAFALLEQTPEDKLTEEEKWARDSIRAAKEKTLDQNKSTFTNEFDEMEASGQGVVKTGRYLTQEEGIPIEELLTFLEQKIAQLPPNTPEWQDLVNTGHILYRNSKFASQFPDRMEPTRLFSRTQQEAYFISQDARKAENMDEDWYKAERTLNKRLELIIPPEDQSPTPEPITPPEPETQDEDKEKDGDGDKEKLPEPEKPIIREGVLGNRDLDPWKRAREIADKLINKEKARGSGWNPLNWGRKVGIYLLGDFWRQRLTNEIHESIIQTNNSYLELDMARSVLVARDLFRGHTDNLTINQNANFAQEQEAARAKIVGIKTQYTEGVTASGQVLENPQQRTDIVEATGPLKEAIMSDILRPLIDGTNSPLLGEQIQTTDDIQRALRVFISNHKDDADIVRLFGPDSTQYHNLAEYFATDLMELADQIRGDVDANRYALDQIDEHTKILLANARWAGETQAHFDNVDRMVARISGNRVLGVTLNATTIGVAASLAAMAVSRIPTLASYAGVVIPGAGMIFGGAAAYVRKRHELNTNIGTHRLERAYNEPIQPNSPNREALEQFDYDVASSADLISHLRAATEQNLSDGQNGNRQNVARAIAEISTRLDFSEREGVDLVSANKTGFEQGRLALLQEIIEARRALRNAGMSNDEIQNMEREYTTAWNTQFVQNREQQDNLFKTYSRDQAFYAGTRGAILGLVGGAAAQQVFAEAARHAPELGNVPIIGGLFQTNRTSLEQGLNWVAGKANHPELWAAPANPETFQNVFQNGGEVNINDHLRAAVNPNGTVSIIGNQGEILAQGSMSAEGNITNLQVDTGISKIATERLQNELNNAGFTTTLHEDVTRIPGKTETQNALDHFKEKLEKAQRLSWSDNGTPMHLNSRGVLVGADGKEVQFYHHVLQDGSIDLDMSNMVSQLTPAGGVNWDNTIDSSYGRIANDIITNPDGTHTFRNFQMLITPNNAADTAREVISINVGPDGHATIPAGSDLRQFFAVQGDKPIQLARFIEVAHVEPTGGRIIISTNIGSGIDNIQVTTPPIETHHFSLDVTPPPPLEVPTDILPIIPIIPEWGSPLESTAQPTKPEQTSPEEPSRETRPGPITPQQRLEKETELAEKRKQLEGLEDNLENQAPREQLQREIDEIEEFLNSEQAPLENRPYPLEEVFQEIKGPVSRNHEYFIENPPEKIEINPQQLEDLISTKPFFIEYPPDEQGRTIGPNLEVVPFIAQPIGQQPRFTNGEAVTNNDSALLALAATSAETPQEQTKLYRALTNAILQMHRQYPILLNSWMFGQNQNMGRSGWTSYEVFASHDSITPGQLRPIEERLVVFERAEHPLDVWDARLNELTDLIDQNQPLQPYHLRWIEFLSHSVNIPELMKLAKEQQSAQISTPASPPPVTPITPTPPAPPGPTAPPLTLGPTETLASEVPLERVTTAEYTVGSHTPSEDSVVSNSEHGFIGVFDGLGGEPAGDVASQIVRDNMAFSLQALPQNPTTQQVHNAMNEGYQNAIRMMREDEKGHPEHRGMCTTGSVFKLYTEDGITKGMFMHAGDSRIYAVRKDGSVQQLTEDDSSLADDVKSGRITPERAREIAALIDEADNLSGLPDDAKRYWATRNEVGNMFYADQAIPPKIQTGVIGPDTVFIIATSDGVHDNLKASEIAAICKGKTDPEEIAKALVEAAIEVFSSRKNGRAKRDDVTAAVIEIPQPPTLTQTPTTSAPTPPSLTPTVRPQAPTPPAPLTETVVTATPIPIFVTSEEVQKAPGGLAEVVNQHLNDATQDRVRLETTPDNLVKYLQTLQIPNTTKVESPHARIENGRLIVTSKITGSVKVGVGPLSKNVEVSPNIEAILETDPITRKLRVSGYKLSGINRAQEMALRALAGKYINNLDELMRGNINREVDPNWEVTGFNIVGDKLAFDFRKLYMSVLV